MEMVEIRDVKPLGPIWHKRPNEKVEKSEEKPSTGQQHKKDDDSGKDGDDDKPHVDEYA